MQRLLDVGVVLALVELGVLLLASDRELDVVVLVLARRLAVHRWRQLHVDAVHCSSVVARVELVGRLPVTPPKPLQQMIAPVIESEPVNGMLLFLFLRLLLLLLWVLLCRRGRGFGSAAIGAARVRVACVREASERRRWRFLLACRGGGTESKSKYLGVCMWESDLWASSGRVDEPRRKRASFRTKIVWKVVIVEGICMGQLSDFELMGAFRVLKSRYRHKIRTGITVSRGQLDM